VAKVSEKFHILAEKVKGFMKMLGLIDDSKIKEVTKSTDANTKATNNNTQAQGDNQKKQQDGTKAVKDHTTGVHHQTDASKTYADTLKQENKTIADHTDGTDKNTKAIEGNTAAKNQQTEAGKAAAGEVADLIKKQQAEKLATEQNLINTQLTGIDQVDKAQLASLDKQNGKYEEKIALVNKIEKAEIDAVKKLAAGGVISQQAAQQKITEIESAASEKRIQISNKEAEAKAKNQEREKAIAKKIGQEMIKMAQQVSDAIFANAQQRRDNELKATEDNLNAQKNAELLNTTLTASQRNAIEKKYKAEEAQAKLQAWKRDQKAKEEQAIINGLLAFTAALASSPPPMNYVNAAIALASAGVQAGIIASKTPPKFAKGTKGSATLPSGMKLVGEEGPELLWTPGGEKVITAPDTAKFLEAYNIPMLSTFPRLDVRDLSAVSQSAGRGDHMIDYEKLGKVVAKNIPAPVVNSIQLNEKGFIKHLTSRGNRTEYVNNEIKF
jgi:hypothetical protein